MYKSICDLIIDTTEPTAEMMLKNNQKMCLQDGSRKKI